MIFFSRPMFTSFLKGIGLSFGWTAIWVFALTTPLKPFLVLIGHYGFGKHGYLLGLIPPVVIGVIAIGKGKRGNGVNLIVGAIMGMLTCVVALALFLMTASNIPTISLW